METIENKKTQTSKLNIFYIKRYKRKNNLYLNNDKFEEYINKGGQIENFIMESIGSLGYHKMGHSIQNIYIRNILKTEDLLYVSSKNFYLKFPSFILELSKKMNMKFFSVFILKNIYHVFNHQER